MAGNADHGAGVGKVADEPSRICRFDCTVSGLISVHGTRTFPLQI